MPKGKPNKRYTAEFKQRVIEDMRENDLSYKEIRRKYDLLNRDIVSYSISDRPALSMVTQMLNTAFLKTPDGTNLILHSDQG